MSKLLASFVALTGLCATANAADTPRPVKDATGADQHSAILATADIIDIRGSGIGHATFRQGPRGVLIGLTVTALPPGTHGVHIHETGQCEVGSKFASAHNHVGGAGKQHGYLNPKGHHAGDLPNLTVAADGTGGAEFYSEDIFILGKAGKGRLALLDADGSSLVIHEKADNGYDQPSGGAAGRIACGPIRSR